jgi:hypothetical protein
MKTRIIERTIIFLAYNIYIITDILFAASFVISVLFGTLFAPMPLPIGYLFWFCFGLFAFSRAIRLATDILKTKSEEKNDYYLELKDRTRVRIKDK